VIESLQRKDISAIYGDAGDSEFLSDIRAHLAKLIISTIPDISTTLSLLHYLKQRKFRGVVIVTVKTNEEAQKCYQSGATYVIVPRILGAHKFRELLLQNQTKKQAWKPFAFIQ
jgi:voltage-gated potassium channel Kch